jgi:hypothetical protein
MDYSTIMDVEVTKDPQETEINPFEVHGHPAL